jgi:Fur family zinc uptake transcriptional regulator
MENAIPYAKRIKQILQAMNGKAKPSATIISPFHGEHDHSQCQSQALKNALARCQRRGLKLTKTRQQVLEIVWSSHNPIGAYDVLQKLQEQGHKPAPPTAYRALDFLVSTQLVHRIESLNAYIGCPSSDVRHQCQFYICTKCGHIAETNSSLVDDALQDGAKQLGFESEQAVIEVHGVCRLCQESPKR